MQTFSNHGIVLSSNSKCFDYNDRNGVWNSYLGTAWYFGLVIYYWGRLALGSRFIGLTSSSLLFLKSSSQTLHQAELHLFSWKRLFYFILTLYVIHFLFEFQNRQKYTIRFYPLQTRILRTSYQLQQIQIIKILVTILLWQNL